MAEVSQQMYVGSEQVFAFIDDKWAGINSYEKVVLPPYQIRTDTYSGSVQLAVPGTLFSASPISMTNYYDDISSKVRGVGSNLTVTPSGSASEFTSSATTNFSAEGYTTSILSKDAGALLGISPTALAIAAQQFVFEGYFYFVESWLQPPFWHAMARQNDGVTDDFYADIGTGGISAGTTVRQRIIINGNQYFTTSFTATLNTWVHVAWVRSTSGALYSYYNGTRRSNGTSTASVNTNGTMRILGGASSANDGEEALHQDLRITIGTDRGYNTTTITPPSSIVEPTS